MADPNSTPATDIMVEAVLLQGVQAGKVLNNYNDILDYLKERGVPNSFVEELTVAQLKRQFEWYRRRCGKPHGAPLSPSSDLGAPLTGTGMAGLSSEHSFVSVEPSRISSFEPNSVARVKLVPPGNGRDPDFMNAWFRPVRDSAVTRELADRHNWEKSNDNRMVKILWTRDDKIHHKWCHIRDLGPDEPDAIFGEDNDDDMSIENGERIQDEPYVESRHPGASREGVESSTDPQLLEEELKEAAKIMAIGATSMAREFVKRRHENTSEGNSAKRPRTTDSGRG